MDKWRLVGDLKVPDAAVTLRGGKTKGVSISVFRLKLCFNKKKTSAAAHLSTQVDDVGVGVVERQQDAVAGVHLLDANRLVHVVLEAQNKGRRRRSPSIGRVDENDSSTTHCPRVDLRCKATDKLGFLINFGST